MKMNHIHKVLLVILMIGAVNAKDLQIGAKKLSEIQKTSKVLNRPNVTLLRGLDKGTYYFLELSVKSKKRQKIAYAFLEKKSGIMYTGSRYDKNGQKMKFPKTKIVSGVIKDGVTFSYGTGKKDLYIVTDPECPYCVEFEKKSAGKLKEYTVHVILYPLSMHKRAPAMVEWIMQGKTDAEKAHKMEEIMVKNSREYIAMNAKKGKKFTYSKATQEKLDKGKKAASMLGAKGTPSVYDASFVKLNWRVLLRSLK
jgi:thiol:disulfide interchange protein DsbC